MSPSKADENKRFISLVRDHQKVEPHATLPAGYAVGVNKRTGLPYLKKK